MEITKAYIDCFSCFYYRKGECRAKNIEVRFNSPICVFYMVNWKKIKNSNK